jgi:hypothetical protein
MEGAPSADKVLMFFLFCLGNKGDLPQQEVTQSSAPVAS